MACGAAGVAGIFFRVAAEAASNAVARARETQLLERPSRRHLARAKQLLERPLRKKMEIASPIILTFSIG